YSLLEDLIGTSPSYGAELAGGRGRMALAAAGSDATKLEEAVRWLRRACELDPASGPRLRGLGAALGPAGRGRGRAGRQRAGRRGSVRGTGGRPRGRGRSRRRFSGRR